MIVNEKGDRQIDVYVLLFELFDVGYQSKVRFQDFKT